MWRGLIVVAALGAAGAEAQLDGSVISLEHAAIGYASRPVDNPVAALQKRLEDGSAELALDSRPGIGYLPALLEALDLPVESQLLVYSKTSLQARLIDPKSPRAIYFNDSLTLGAVQGGLIEIAVQDARQGAVFYTLDPQAGEPRLLRQGACLGCHYSLATLGVPGFFVRSAPTAADGQILPWLGNATVTHETPLVERWGGWYVTGDVGENEHLGNLVIPDRRAQELPPHELTVPPDLSALALDGYLTPYSDAVAHLVFEHQIEAMNVLTRLGWEFRVALAERRPLAELSRTVEDAVDYLLFVGEAPLKAVHGTSGFAERFAALGPHDDKGRSLRQLELDGRLMRYPLSYMVYSNAFDNLPDEARDAVYRRLWDVLSGAATDARYAHLAAAEREALVEILVATKPELPAYFGYR